MIPFDRIQKIAIFRRNGLGDVLCSIPLILRCKELMPQAKVTLFLEKSGFCLAPFLKGPDEIALIPSSINKYLGILQHAWQWRGEKFDLAISAKTSPMKLMNFSLWAVGAPNRIAYVEGKWHEKLISLPRIYDPNTQIHQALQAIQLIDPEMKEVPRRLYPSLHSVEKKRLFSQKTILISLSNNRVGSTLSIERFSHLLNAFSKKVPFALAISCLPKDLFKARLLSSQLLMEHQIFSTPHFTDFLTLLNGADAIFACDGGIVHLAAALQKPSLFLFGGTKVERWGPLSKEALTIAHTGHVMEIDEEVIFQKLKEVIA